MSRHCIICFSGQKRAKFSFNIKSTLTASSNYEILHLRKI